MNKKQHKSYLAYLKKWRHDNKEKIKIGQHDWYMRNKDHLKTYQLKNKSKIREQYTLRTKLIVKQWKAWFKEQYGDRPLCEICGRQLFWNGHRNFVVTFDHKTESKVIIGPPQGWMRTHVCNDKNRKSFESCNFGILCAECNQFLPTKNREHWLNNAMNYVKREVIMNSFPREGYTRKFRHIGKWICLDCGHLAGEEKFIMPIEEDPRCPECGSDNVSQY